MAPYLFNPTLVYYIDTYYALGLKNEFCMHLVMQSQQYFKLNQL